MRNMALQVFRASIASVLRQHSIVASGHSLSLLEKMYHIKHFYSNNKEYIIFWIEGTLNQNPDITCRLLLDEMDLLVNRHFGLEQDFPMADSIYKEE